MQPPALNMYDRFSEDCLMGLEAARETGVKIAGIYCIFAPVELIYAAGAVPIGLCGKKEAPISAAEEILPAALCPLIKSSFGYARTNSCPFFDASDFIVGETTCDGKKKMFELMAQMKPLHVMQLPYACSDTAALQYWYEEVLRFKAFLEDQTGQKIDDKELKKQISLANRIRLACQRLIALNMPGREPLKGMTLLAVMESKGFILDPETYLDQLDRMIDDLETSITASRPVFNKPRILLTGTPLGKGSEKVLQLIEDTGGIVVAMENCTGLKGIYNLVDETLPDLYMAIARRYLKTPCSCMTPNTGRFELLSRLIEDFDIHGVVDLSWQCCHTYHIESRSVETHIKQQINIPFINISTDYSESDIGQLTVRIEAFMELLYGHYHDSTGAKN
ncbi:MAG: 2-hydroxyacyl-CoA dehydratase family protein [Proteobacteria bacterium]|nr:2-hydroxyacyl-CoA dehydratase family protein [Pseudomonadota bacterium]